MDFKDLADFCQAQAVANKLHPTDESVWRKFCREYSNIFNTPLHIVKAMEPVDVVLELYEYQLDDISLDDNMETILDVIYSLEDPEYAKYKRDELKSFMKEAEEEEEQRQRAGRPIHKAMLDDDVSIKNSIPKEAPISEPIKPRSGGIKFTDNNDGETGEDF